MIRATGKLYGVFRWQGVWKEVSYQDIIAKEREGQATDERECSEFSAKC